MSAVDNLVIAFRCI